MTGLLNMSRKEIDRFSLLSQVLAKKLTQAKAAQLLELSERQVRNLLQEIRNFGPHGLISKKRGTPSNRKFCKDFQKTVMELIQEKYSDFGPTLAAEKLQENHQIRVSRETLRLWMTKSHLWIPKVKKRNLHPLRKRKEFFGEMLQGDGSHHDWFETGQPCALVYFIDDATGLITAGCFSKGESLNSYFDILEQHLKNFGIPISIYTDKFRVFDSGKENSLTQFRRALTELGIKWIGANSPQGKGRIERSNRTLQDRLIKEMRLKGIKTIEEGNRFLKDFFALYNSKFSKEPMKALNLHRSLEGFDISRALSRCEERTLTKDLSFQFHSKHYQILEPRNSIAGKKIEVRIKKDGTIRIFSGCKELKFKSFTEIQSEKRQLVLDAVWPTRTWASPKLAHPWKAPSYARYLKEKTLRQNMV